MTVHVAIIGSGPAGFYAAQALLLSDSSIRVDMFERLPTPYGLVRGGVAPDHPKIKGVTRVYDKTASLSGFRYFGHVTVGRDVSHEELITHYHQVVYAVGNEGDRRLGIPGEGAWGVTPASVMVGWYNGHPDYREAVIDLHGERVAVVGNGNVAMDLVRILCRTTEELRTTDISAHALEALAHSEVREVWLIGRRGPVQAAFTPTELKELGHLAQAEPVVQPTDLDLDPASQASLEGASKQVLGNMKLLHTYAEAPPRGAPRKVHLMFCQSPTEILSDADGRVTGLRLERNELVPREGGGVGAKPSGELMDLPVDRVFTAIGFRGTALPGVPFDSQRHVIANEGGRVVRSDTREVIPNVYVVGWARSGPRGLIGSHRAASKEVVKLMMADQAAGTVDRHVERDPEALLTLLKERGITPVTFDRWKIIDRIERQRGERRGAPRDKLTDTTEMLEMIAHHSPFREK